MSFDEVLAKFPDAKRNGQGYVAKCPAHEDRSPSLSVTEGHDGATLVKCHAGCDTESVCRAAGIALADLFVKKPAPRNGSFRIVAEYDYLDETGNLLFQVCRLDPKDFRQRKPDPTAKDGWSWKTAGVRRVPYRLPELIAAVADGRPIFIAEGEKDVAALNAAGFAATSNPGGAGKWQSDFAEFFKGAEVFIIADKDTPGRKHAQAVAENLHGVAATVRVLELPDTNGKPVKDPSDYFAAGGQAAELDQLAQDAPLWTPPQAEQDPLPGNDDPPEDAAPQPPEAKSLGDLKRRIADDPAELIRAGYLCRGGGLLLAAPTGVGKSSFAIQSQIMFALGRPMFGITPARPTRSLYIQAENDEGDLAEMRDGVIAGLSLTPGELETIYAGVITAQENARTGPAFFNETVAPLLELHRPDLLWIDPALSYIGGEASSQKDVGSFLRNLLNPLLTRFNCGCVVVHHTNKPSKGEEKSVWQAGDFAYLGSGSAEWANWARAVLAIRSLGSHNVFELRAGKRGARIGWKDAEGNQAFSRLIGHATEPGVICWRDASADEATAKGDKRPGTAADLKALVPLEKPIEKNMLILKWQTTHGNKDTGRLFLDELLEDESLFEWRVKRPKTGPAKMISRKPQTLNPE